MSDMLPLATYTLNVEPYDPTPAIGMDMPVTIRITMAALDPEPFDDEKKPSTLRMIKRNPDYDLYDYEDSEDEDVDEESEEEEEEKTQKKGKKAHKHDHDHDHDHEHDHDDEEEDDEENEDEVDDEFQECVLATLSPESGFQQTLDITIAPEEDVQFVVTGSYTISLSGNYIKHPFDTPIEGLDSDEDEEDYDEDDEDINDLINDEDDEEIEDMDEEQLSDELDDLEEASDIESRIEELVAEEDNKKKSKKQNNKRKQEETEAEEEKPKEEKKNKKAKKVEFKKGLEEGPTKKAEPKAKTLAGGIVVEDRATGKGSLAKKGSRIGMRYIGKLKNGKVFDKNTSGKPFTFKLGQGEVIKGWDIGVAGMAVGGERRIVIPAPYAYGKQALPGIPANSELTFDVKLVSMK